MKLRISPVCLVVSVWRDVEEAGSDLGAAGVCPGLGHGGLYPRHGPLEVGDIKGRVLRV